EAVGPSKSDNVRRARPPAAAAGTADIPITTEAGASAHSAADQFNSVGAPPVGTAGIPPSGGPASTAPTITSLSASSGALTGGDSITIHGTNFNGVTAVMF